MREMKKRGGRPEKSEKEKKDLILHIRVTAEQKLLLEQAATRAGADLSTYVRMTALERARGQGGGV